MSRYLLCLDGIGHDSFWCIPKNRLGRVQLLAWDELNENGIRLCPNCVLDKWPTAALPERTRRDLER